MLRLVGGSLGVAQGVAILGPAHPEMALAIALIQALAGLLLAAGFLTPFAGAILAAVNLSVVLSWTAHPPQCCFVPHFLAFAAIDAGIALLGPGALSVDARLFGRHRVIIPTPRK